MKKSLLITYALVFIGTISYYLYSFPFSGNTNQWTNFSERIQAKLDAEHSFDKKSRTITLDYSIQLRLKDMFKINEEKLKLKIKYFEFINNTKGDTNSKNTAELKKQFESVLSEDGISFSKTKINLYNVSD